MNIYFIPTDDLDQVDGYPPFEIIETFPGEGLLVRWCEPGGEEMKIANALAAVALYEDFPDTFPAIADGYISMIKRALTGELDGRELKAAEPPHVSSAIMQTFFKRGIYNITITHRGALSVELVKEQEPEPTSVLGLVIHYLRGLDRGGSAASAQEVEDAMDTLQKLATDVTPTPLGAQTEEECEFTECGTAHYCNDCDENPSDSDRPAPPAPGLAFVNAPPCYRAWSDSRDNFHKRENCGICPSREGCRNDEEIPF